MKHLKTLILFGIANFAVMFGAVYYYGHSSSRPAPASQALPASAEVEWLYQQAAEIPLATSSSALKALSADKTAAKPKTSPATSAAAKPGPSPAPVQPAPTPTPPPVADNRCIVTVKGKHYDMTSFRKEHAGGDIFKCGTDMTDLFFSVHDQNLLDTQMAKYLVP